MLPVQLRHKFKDHLAGAAIKVTGGLISQQNLRLGDERPSQSQPLLLSSGKFAGAMIGPSLQSYFTQPARSFRFSRGFRLSASEQRHRDVLECGEFREKIVKLPHIADFAITKLGGIILGKRIHLGVGAVYGTGGGPIKRSQDV